MITPGWATRLQTVFGAPLEQVTEQHLKRLVQDGVREHSDLDFKQQPYGNSDADRRELAADIAQFANDRGGVIVIGVRDEEEVATECTPLTLDSKECDRMLSIAAERVTPYAHFEPRTVPCDSDPKCGYFLLVVPSSPDRPHAVRNGKDLRYPRRHGTQKRWLSESEVADAYRDRFTRATAEVDRVDRLVRGGLERCQATGPLPYLVVGLVPSQAASFQVDAASVKRMEQWAQGAPWLYGHDPFAGPFRAGPRKAGVGARRILLGTVGGYGLDTSYGYMEVHEDGSALACMPLDAAIFDRPLGPMGSVSDELMFPPTALTLCMAGCLRATASASLEVGSFGDCLVTAKLYGNKLRMVEYDNNGFQRQLSDVSIDGPLRSDHTLTLESLGTMSPDLLIATRQVCADFVQALGFAELATVTTDGHLTKSAFPSGYHQMLTNWSEQTGIPFTI